MIPPRAAALIAKLLSQENLHVYFDTTIHTASFDLENRVLSLPLFDDNSEIGRSYYAMQTFILHEASHALHTPTKDYMQFLDEHEDLQYELNVVEDARVDKRMQRKFPGAVKIYNNGFSFFQEQDFFNINDTDVESLPFVERLNLQFKSPFTMNFPFSSQEWKIVEKIKNAETFQDVIDIVLEIQQDQQDEQDEQDEQDVKNKNESNVNDAQAKRNTTTQDEFNNRLQKQVNNKADNVSNHTYETILLQSRYLDDNWQNHVISVEDFLHRKESGKNLENVYIETVKMQQSLINMFYKEFLMRKNAKVFQRSSIQDSGMLDMNKLYSYKTTDNVFLSFEQITHEKNHGMVLFIDFSHSMIATINKVLQQVIAFIEFANKEQIPFSVYGYTTMRKHLLPVEFKESKAQDVFFDKGALRSFVLVHVADSSFTKKQHIHNFSLLMNERYMDAAMGGTPTKIALYVAPFIIEKMKQTYGLDKTSFTVYMDGLSNDAYYSISKHNIALNTFYLIAEQRSNIPMAYYDPIHTLTYLANEAEEAGFDEAALTSVLIKRVKDITAAKTIGIFSIIKSRYNPNAYHGLFGTLNGRLYTISNHFPVKEFHKRTVLSDENFLHSTTVYGCDYFSLQFTPDQSEERFNVTEVPKKASLRRTMNSFLKIQSNKRDSMYFVSHFMQAVA